MTSEASRRTGLFSTIGVVYRSLYQWRGDLLRLTWPFVLLEFIYLWARFIASNGPFHDETSLVSLAYLSLALITIIPLAARVQQFTLAPGPVDNWLQHGNSRRNWLCTRAIVAWSLPILLTLIIASTIMMLVSNPAVYGITAVNVSIGLLMTLVLSVIVTRLILVFPLAFDKGIIDLSQAWKLSTGRYLSLFLLFGFSTVPFRLVYRLCDLIGQEVWSNNTLSTASKLAFYFFVVFLPSTLAIVAQMIVLIAAITLVYREVTTGTNHFTLPPEHGQ